MQLDQILTQIINTPYFQKLKSVTENNDYHDHETVYDHLIKTKNTAQNEIIGNFITNPLAKEQFSAFINDDVHGIDRKDAMVITALVHDIGKFLICKEDQKKEPINVMMLDGKTYAPGHEYYGSVILLQVLHDILPDDVIAYIASVVKLHDTFNPDYFLPKKQWLMNRLIHDIKARAEGKYIEALFNIYCDGYSAYVFQETKDIIANVFNDPSLYTLRVYEIPQ